MGKVIEPSEIITGKTEEIHSRPSRANPWVRLIGRFFDYSLFFFGIHFLMKWVSWPYGNIIPIEFFAWIPIETILLSTIGTTPGKWLLKTELRKGSCRRLPFACALRRSFSVWFRGLGMGIPFVNALCMLSAFYRLRVFESTSWDRDEGIVVTHHPIGQWRLYLASGIMVIGLVYYSLWKKGLI